MRKSAIALTAIAASAAMLLAGCGGDASGDDGKDRPYRVLLSSGQSASGTLGVNSKTAVIAVKASVKNVNAAGGVDGRKVELAVVEDGGDPTTAVTKLREALASDKKPDLYLNSGPSVVSAATLPIAKQNNLLTLNMAPFEGSDDPKVYPLNFDLSPGASDYAEGFVPYLKESGYKTLGIIHSSTAWGITNGKAYKATFKAAGFDVVDVEEYDAAALDMTPQLEAIKAKKPDALIMDAYGAPLGYLLKGIEKLGWDVPIVANNSVTATSLSSTPEPDGLVGSALVKNLKMQVFNSTVKDPSATATNAAVKAMLSFGKIPAAIVIAYDYDALPLVAAAAEKTGSIKAEDIAKALVDPAVQEKAGGAIISRYNFSAELHSPQADPSDFKFISPGLVTDGQFQE